MELILDCLIRITFIFNHYATGNPAFYSGNNGTTGGLMEVVEARIVKKTGRMLLPVDGFWLLVAG
ncbi:MAG: hypothetical protein JST18_00800 [Bacteroidetes bacterium]|nr:hypothetical protein [Bacteroidota bacterium]